MAVDRFGWGDFVYELAPGWGKFPDGVPLDNCSDAFVDKNDRVYMLLRGEEPVMEMDKDGNVLDIWGKGIFGRAHGIFVDDDGFIYIADDKDHTVRKFDKNHNIVMTLGTANEPSDTGITKPHAWKTIKQPAGPFNAPTAVAVDDVGNIYVSDGYGNCRVHKFSPDGVLMKSWGDIGDKPSCFAIPHGISVLGNTVYVCDRQNYRVQLFDLDGNFKEAWSNFYRPAKIAIKDRTLFICENVREALFNEAPNRVVVCDESGTVLSHIQGTHRYSEGDQYHCAHGMAIDSEWSLYICDACKKPPEGFVGIHKYRRVK